MAIPGEGTHRVGAPDPSLTSVSGLSSTTTAGLARRFTDPQWTAVETGVMRVTQRMLERLPAARRTRVVSHGDDRSRRQ